MPDVPDDLQDLSEYIHANDGIETLDAVFTVLVNADDTDWRELDHATRLHLTGVMYNLSEDLQRQDGLDRIIELHTNTVLGELSEEQAAVRHYQLANAYSLRDAWNDQDTVGTFFDSDDLRHAIGHARATVSDDYHPILGQHRQTQAFTNFASYLARTGRVCEAMHWHNKAVNNNPEFGMAVGKRAQTKRYYASILFSEPHTARFLHSAYADYRTALQNRDDLYPAAAKQFKAEMQSIEKFSDHELSFTGAEEYELGDSDIDVQYHEWVLNERLYLTPLNDISTHSLVSHDPITLPGMIMPDGEEFPYPGVYNQIKQEFVSARYQYFEGKTRGSGGHFSDRNVALQDTLDYSVYGYRTEQIKTALRMAYSVFDKIAVLINEYWDVGQNDPSFRYVWNEDGQYSKGLAEPFGDSDNWPLNALYWLKKDFHPSISKDGAESDVVVAHELKTLRDAVEHDYIKVYRDGIVSEPPDRSWLQDSLYHPVGKTELRTVTVEMLRLARAALLYITFAIAHEERKKRQEHGDKGFIPMGGGATVPDREKE